MRRSISGYETTRARSTSFSQVPHSPSMKQHNNGSSFSMLDEVEDNSPRTPTSKRKSFACSRDENIIRESPKRLFSQRARSNSLSAVPHSPIMKFGEEECDAKQSNIFARPQSIGSSNSTTSDFHRTHSSFLAELAPPMPMFSRVSRSSSMTAAATAPIVNHNIQINNTKNNRNHPRPAANRRGSLVPLELRRSGSIGSHRRGSLVPMELRRSGSIGSHRRGSLVRSSSIVSRKDVPTTEGSCDDGWTPLGLEYFVANLTVPHGNTDPEDWHSVQWLNRAARTYESVGHNDEAALQEVQRLLSLAKTTTSFFAGARDSNLGVVLFRMGATKEALQLFHSANQLLDFAIPIQDAGAGESIYLRVAVLLNYSRTLVRFNQIDAARKHCHQIMEIVKEFLNSHPTQYGIPREIQNQVRWLGNVAQYYVLGMVSQRAGDLPKALELYTTILNKARHDLGHSHVHVATLLYMKGMVLFDQRKLHQAMLAQLASLRIYDMLDKPNIRELARVLYSIGRTLHDREDYQDALRMYQRTLSIQKQINPSAIATVTTMCNIARVHHITGDVEAALRENEEIVILAEQLAQGKPHPFWANRLVVLGNMYVETGRYDKAMTTFDKAIKAGGGDQVFVGCPFDVDSRLASSLAKAGLQHPCAACA